MRCCSMRVALVISNYITIIVTICLFITVDGLCIDSYGSYVNVHLPEIQEKSHFRKRPGRFSREQECMEVFNGMCFVSGKT